MKKSFVFTLMLLVITVYSCKKEDISDSNTSATNSYSGPDLTVNIVGDYYGHIYQTTDGSMKKIDGYKITVSKIAGNRVKITPVNSAQVSFEAEIFDKYPTNTYRVYERVAEEHPKAITLFEIKETTTDYRIRYNLVKGYMNHGINDVVDDATHSKYLKEHYEQVLWLIKAK